MPEFDPCPECLGTRRVPAGGPEGTTHDATGPHRHARLVRCPSCDGTGGRPRRAAPSPPA